MPRIFSFVFCCCNKIVLIVIHLGSMKMKRLEIVAGSKIGRLWNAWEEDEPPLHDFFKKILYYLR